jgi:ATP-binding cassette, subfamily B, bacterial
LPADHGRIEEAARLSGADEMIRRLRHGYDTVLGRWFDEGEDLSTGQWQEIALARAFVRDAQIVILDEPTSALDPLAEYNLFLKFHELAAKRTAVIVSHRMSTVRMADRIAVLDGGRVAEHGTHDELLRLGGTYARLFELQAGRYR